MDLFVYVVLRQSLTLVAIETGPFEAAGKNVASVVKSLDEKLFAVGVVAEKVKSQCKGCRSVSGCEKQSKKVLHVVFNLGHLFFFL